MKSKETWPDQKNQISLQKPTLKKWRSTNYQRIQNNWLKEAQCASEEHR